MCLDFVNTVGAITSDTPTEYLPDYAALVVWSMHAELLSDATAQHLLAVAAQQPAASASVVQHAHQLRALLHRVFGAVAKDEQVSAADLATFNSFVAGALAHMQVAPTGTGYTWTWADDRITLDRMLWPLVRSAAELLVTGDLSRVRVCGGERCGWLFVDTSKNRSRRWCDMQACGNVAKVRLFRTRQHEAHKPGE